MQPSAWKPSNRVMQKRVNLVIAGAALCLSVAPCVSAQAPAHEPSKVPGSAADLTAPRTIDENHPERSIPTPEQAMKNPLQMGYLLMDLIARGEAATEIGDHEAAIRYYRAIAKAVPERAVSFCARRPRYQAAMPPIKPPPPTATSSVSRPGAWRSSSRPRVPWPIRVVG